MTSQGKGPMKARIRSSLRPIRLRTSGKKSTLLSKFSSPSSRLDSPESSTFQISPIQVRPKTVIISPGLTTLGEIEKTTGVDCIVATPTLVLDLPPLNFANFDTSKTSSFTRASHFGRVGHDSVSDGPSDLRSFSESPSKHRSTGSGSHFNLYLIES